MWSQPRQRPVESNAHRSQRLGNRGVAAHVTFANAEALQQVVDRRLATAALLLQVAADLLLRRRAGHASDLGTETVKDLVGMTNLLRPRS